MCSNMENDVTQWTFYISWYFQFYSVFRSPPTWRRFGRLLAWSICVYSIKIIRCLFVFIGVDIGFILSYYRWFVIVHYLRNRIPLQLNYAGRRGWYINITSGNVLVGSGYKTNGNKPLAEHMIPNMRNIWDRLPDCIESIRSLMYW